MSSVMDFLMETLREEKDKVSRLTEELKQVKEVMNYPDVDKITAEWIKIVKKEQDKVAQLEDELQSLKELLRFYEKERKYRNTQKWIAKGKGRIVCDCDCDGDNEACENRDEVD